MTHETICNAIRSRVGSQLEIPYGYVVGYDNAPFEPPAAGTYLEATIIFGESVQRSLGSTGQKRFRHLGILNILISVPINTGDGAALDIAGNVEAAFRSIETSGVVYQVPSLIRIGQNGKVYQVAVQCPFYADDIG